MGGFHGKRKSYLCEDFRRRDDENEAFTIGLINYSIISSSSSKNEKFRPKLEILKIELKIEPTLIMKSTFFFLRNIN